MNRLPFALFLTLLVAGFASGGTHQYFSVSHVKKGKDFHFPILNFHRNARVETKINRLLQLSELMGLVDQKRRKVFEQIMINDGGLYGRKVSLFYQVYTNNPRVFSVRIDNSMDGATTHWWASYYNFNAQNGDVISLRDLFTEAGYEKFFKLTVSKRSQAYRSEVARKIVLGERETYLQILGSIETDDLSDFALGDRSITVDGSDLLGKAYCCADLRMAVRFDLQVFRPWLNEYGRTVFALQPGNLARFRSNNLPQLFTGTVDGKSPFAAVLNVIGGEQIEGVYAYLKYRKGIYLDGTLENNQVHLNENVLVETEMNYNTDSNHRYTKGGSISGKLDSSGLNGIWTDKQGQISLALVARRD